MTRWSITVAALLLPAAGSMPNRTSVSIVHASAATCFAPLTLELRPGPVPGGVGLLNGAPARDIPPNPVVTHLPLYPTAAPSTGRIPPYNFQTFPPAYRKIALIEFALPTGLSAAMGWYGRAMQGCGFVNNGSASFPGSGRPRFAALFFTSRDSLRYVSLTFRPVSPHLTLVRYLVQTLDLPPRPAASFLHGPFVRVAVFYQSQGVISGSNRQYRFTINWQPTIARLVRSVNTLTQIAVSGLGSGGVVLFSETVVLSFVRTDGGIRHVMVGGVLQEVVVGHSRPLVDTNDKVLRLVDRLVHARCHPAQGCS
jgi:hypothetical protein